MSLLDALAIVTCGAAVAIVYAVGVTAFFAASGSLFLGIPIAVSNRDWRHALNLALVILGCLAILTLVVWLVSNPEWTWFP